MPLPIFIILMLLASALLFVVGYIAGNVDREDESNARAKQNYQDLIEQKFSNGQVFYSRDPSSLPKETPVQNGSVIYGPKKGSDLASRLADMGFSVHQFTAYHMRINNCLDLYPINKRWHYIKTGERGGYDDALQFVNEFFIT